ncbi:MAG: hypothetical protein ACJAVI_006065 [Candidatus Azotimanducaceae bacterium]|jgi:hypothetical protein
MLVNAGPMCLLESGETLVLVTSRRSIIWPDPSLIETMGVETALIRM